eukprot:COSAG01_NODE_9199_length_2523_cov_2.215347_2_plen_110_part_00
MLARDSPALASRPKLWEVVYVSFFGTARPQFFIRNVVLKMDDRMGSSSMSCRVEICCSDTSRPNAGVKNVLDSAEGGGRAAPRVLTDTTRVHASPYAASTNRFLSHLTF